MYKNFFLIYGVFALFLSLLICCNSDKSKKIPETLRPKEFSKPTIKRMDYESLINYNLALSVLLDSCNTDPGNLCILIDKSDLILSIFSDSVILKQYPVVLGLNPTDDKLVEGDRCTPEGNFKIIKKSKHYLWSRFLLLDYPNAESLSKIAVARKAGHIPDESIPGGGIGIQGVKEGSDYLIDYKVNWTMGCIAMKNNDIVEIYDFVPLKTVVTIIK